MGAGQSGEDSRDASANLAPVKTSYYELLGIDRQATDDEIKKAYRRKALELHPDRNYGNVEQATSLFAEVQSAYEVLSDPQERAWYDSHEDAILRDVDPTAGKDGGTKYERNVGLTTADDITRMFGRFHGRVEFSDAPSGFFGFLRETFDNLAAEEAKAARQQDLDEVDYPSFGHKDDKHEDVVKTFYAVWSGFSTKKTFSWRDQYSTRGVGDRRTRRVIEKENKRFRDEAIREFNDAVRSLVAFVKKRDPRYTPNTQSEAERQKALRDATAAQAARQRAANAAKLEKEVIPEWAKARDPEELEESSEEESEDEQFECVACRKVFKSQNQYEAHERSKKHQKAVQALRRKLRKDGVELDLEEEELDDAGELEERHGEDDGEANGRESAGSDAQDVPAPIDDLHLHAKQTVPEAADTSSHETTDDTTTNDPPASTDAASDSETAVNSDDAEDTVTPTPSEPDTSPDTLIQAENNGAADERDLGKQAQPKMGKAAQKRAKKAAQTPEAAEQSQHKCAVCNATFPSKTRLFQHIRDFGHAAPVPAAAKGKGKKGKAR